MYTLFILLLIKKNIVATKTVKPNINPITKSPNPRPNPNSETKAIIRKHVSNTI